MSLSYGKLLVLMLCVQLTASRRVVPTRWSDDSHSNISASLQTDLNYAHITVQEQHGRRLEATKAEDHKVVNLPGLDPDSTLSHYAGHLQLRNQGAAGALFYWLFEAPGEKAASAPLLIWLNGGPGCSSMDGLFLELGPFKISNGKLDLNPYSWHHVANVIFIDQPVGTGLSYSKGRYPKNDKEVSEMFYEAIQEFFRIHPSYLQASPAGQLRRESRDIFMTGESHAGHYIPHMVTYIKAENEKTNNQSPRLNIAGIAIGNGWVDPFNQYDVSEFAHGLGFITKDQKNELKVREKQCQNSLNKKNYKDHNCFALLDDVLDATGGGGHKFSTASMYDARLFSKQRVFPPGKDAVEAYLNKRDVRQALHVLPGIQRFMECTDPPYNALAHQDGLGVVGELQSILESGMRVLMFSGQFDIIVNHLGTEKMLSQLKWSGSSEWSTSRNAVWSSDGQNPAGFVKAYKNLAFLVVLDAGHMVPLSKPKESLDMITRFLGNKPLADSLMKIPGRVAKNRRGLVVDVGRRNLLPDTSVLKSFGNGSDICTSAIASEAICHINIGIVFSSEDFIEKGLSEVYVDKMMSTELSLVLLTENMPQIDAPTQPAITFSRVAQVKPDQDPKLWSGNIKISGPRIAVLKTKNNLYAQFDKQNSALRDGYITRYISSVVVSNGSP